MIPGLRRDVNKSTSNQSGSFVLACEGVGGFLQACPSKTLLFRDNHALVRDSQLPGRAKRRIGLLGPRPTCTT